MCCVCSDSSGYPLGTYIEIYWWWQYTVRLRVCYVNPKKEIKRNKILSISIYNICRKKKCFTRGFSNFDEPGNVYTTEHHIFFLFISCANNRNIHIFFNDSTSQCTLHVYKIQLSKFGCKCVLLRQRSSNQYPLYSYNNLANRPRWFVQRVQRHTNDDRQASDNPLKQFPNYILWLWSLWIFNLFSSLRFYLSSNFHC